MKDAHLIGITTRMKLSDIPKTIDATPGTQAWPYLSRQKHPALMLADPDLLGVFDPHDGQPGLLYVFKDGSSISCDFPNSEFQRKMQARLNNPVLLPHEC